MQRILILAYDFPPQRGAGVMRVAKFAQYLPRYGWQPAVITAPPRGTPDPALLAMLPPEVQVHRVPDPLVRLLPPLPGPPGSMPGSHPVALRGRLRRAIRQLAWPDATPAWAWASVQRAATLIAAGTWHALLTTSWPVSTALAGLVLKHRRPRLPWVLDLRDPWSHSDGVWNTPRAPLDRLLERACAQAADRVVVTTPAHARLMAELCPTARVVVIPNGFDRTDRPLSAPPPAEGPLTMVYTGSMLGAMAGHALVPALLQLHACGALHTRLILAGEIEPALLESARPLIDAGMLRHTGRIPYRQALALQQQAHVLLFVRGGDAQGHLSHATKLFEYLAADRHILALVPPGAARDLLMETGGASIVPHDRPDLVVAALRDLQRAWATGRLPGGADAARIGRYERARLAGDLAAVLASVCAGEA